MTRRWYWKLYLVLLTVLTVGGLGLVFYRSEELTFIENIAEWASLPMYLVQLVGLFGFVYGRRIGSARVWKSAFAVIALDFLWTGYSLAINADAFANISAIFLVLMAVVMAGISVPLLSALYIYAFRSDEMWDRVGRR